MIQFFIIFSIIILYYKFGKSSKWNNAVLLFAIFIAQGALLGDSSQLFGFIDHRIMVSILIIVSAKKASSTYIVSSLNNLDYQKKAALFLFFFVTIFLFRYIEIKNLALNITYFENRLFGEPASLFDILKRTIRDFIFLYALYLIMTRLYNVNTYLSLKKGILIGLLLAVISILLGGFFKSLGFDARIIIDELGINRSTGFLGMNSNAAAAMFNMVYGYALANFEKFKARETYFKVLIILSILGIFLTVSKAGFLTFSILTMIFFIRNNKKLSNTVAQVTGILVLTTILYLYIGDNIETRFERESTGETATGQNRLLYWSLYLNDIYVNLDYLIYGNTERPTYVRFAHNTFIHFLFFTGIVPVLILMYIYNKLIFRTKIEDNYFSFTPLYTVIALVSAWITGAGYLNYYFLLILALSYGIPQKFIDLSYLNSISNSKIFHRNV